MATPTTVGPSARPGTETHAGGAGTRADPPGRLSGWRARAGAVAGAAWAPAAAHAASLAAAFVVLVWVNRGNWFFHDDWAFVAERGPGLLGSDLWRPHVDHWSTLPILVFRALVAAVGTSTVWPFLIWAFAAHLGTAHLAWRTALACSADPWVTTAFTAVFAVLGSGAENLTWAFQATLITSILLGYAALRLVDTERLAPGARDLACNLVLLAAVMTSNVGAFLVLAAGILALVRRGVWGAVRSAAVPAVAFAAWFVLYGHDSGFRQPLTPNGLLRIPEFVAWALAMSLDATVGLAGAGAVLVIAIVVWFARRATWAAVRAPALALAAGAAGLFASIGVGRYGPGPLAGFESRYVYLMIALVLPLLALAASDAVRRAPAGAPAGAVAVAVAGLVLVHNVQVLRSYASARVALAGEARRDLLAGVWLVTRGEHVLVDQIEPTHSPNVRVAMARRMVADGELEVPQPDGDALLGARLRLQVTFTPAGRPPAAAPSPGRFRLVGGRGTAGARPDADGCVTVERHGTGDGEGEAVLRPVDGRPASVTVARRSGRTDLTVRSPEGHQPYWWEGAVEGTGVIDDVARDVDLVVRVMEGTTVLCGLSPS